VKAALGPWANDLSTEQLIDRLLWEYPRLAFWRNTWPLEDFVDDGYLPNQCQQYVKGDNYYKDNLWANGYGYVWDFHNTFGMHEFSNVDVMTLREANDCMFYAANNLAKRPPNFQYGIIAWAFNAKAMDGRYFYEPWDIGLVQQYGIGQEVPAGYSDAFGVGEDFFHTLQEWQTVVNSGGACKTNTSQKATLASVMNRWYGQDHPVSNDCGLDDATYNEIIVLGTTYLEDDLTYAVAATHLMDYGEDVGLWGTARGAQLQETMKRMSKPLLWSDNTDAWEVALIDAVVGGIAGGWVHKGAKWFQDQWQNPGASFEHLMSAAPKYLKFRYLSFYEREICDHFETNPQNNIMGYNGDDKCVYWSDFQAPVTWECRNDGTCAASSSLAAKYSTESHCSTNCGHGRWTCVRKPVPANDTDTHHYNQHPHYCLPSPNGECADRASCERSCIAGLTAV